MSEKTLTRADLVESVVENVGLPRHEAAELVESVLQELSSTLACGEPVKLSSFGSFGIREKRQRIGRNPKTGEEVPITPRRVLVFRASNIMKKRIDEGIKASLGKSGAGRSAGGKANGKSQPAKRARSGSKAKTAATTTRKATAKKTAKAAGTKTTARSKGKKSTAKKGRGRAGSAGK